MMKVGVLGGGQLARMLALAGYPLDIKVVAYEPVADSCAQQVMEVVRGDYLDHSRVLAFIQSVDCITFETENIPLACAQLIAKHGRLVPGVEVLRVSQDRLYEKELLQALSVPTANFFNICSWRDLCEALTELSYPAILKTRREGYDGKGQFVLHDQQDAERAWQLLKDRDLILESFVPFDYEVSLIVARSLQGEIRFYPLIANQHENGILRISTAPVLQRDLQILAEEYARRLINHFDYQGVLTIEFFVVNNTLIANEMAPRVHNSGHWTIEGAVTSQFENHLRAICGLPLGLTEAVGYSALYNLIGSVPPLDKMLAISGAHCHIYGKEAKPLRKLGHITLHHLDLQQLEVQLAQLVSMFSPTLRHSATPRQLMQS